MSGAVEEARDRALRTEAVAIDTADGVTLRGELLFPDGEPLGLALVGHAMMVDRRTMDRPRGEGLGSTLARRGYAALLLDFRGHGESRTERPYTIDHIVRYDVPAFARALPGRFRGLPRFLVGHSLGVNAGLPGLARMGDHGIAAAVAIGLNLWSPRFEPSPVRRAQKRLMLAAWNALALPGAFDPAPLGMGKSKIPRAYVQHFARMYREGRIGSADGTEDYEALLGQLTLPVLVVSGGRDALMANPESVSAYSRLLPRAPLLHRRYVGPGGFEPDHMGLVIDPRARGLFEEICDFLDAVRAGRFPARVSVLPG